MPAKAGGKRDLLEIDRVEVVEAKSALEALQSPEKGRLYDYTGVSDPKRIIGAEVQLAMGRAGETVSTPFVRAWSHGIPFIARRKSPQSPAGLIGGGLLTTNKDLNTNLIVVDVFGKTWYFVNKMANINDYMQPDREISETEFMDMVWRP